MVIWINKQWAEGIIYKGEGGEGHKYVGSQNPTLHWWGPKILPYTDGGHKIWSHTDVWGHKILPYWCGVGGVHKILPHTDVCGGGVLNSTWMIFKLVWDNRKCAILKLIWGRDKIGCMHRTSWFLYNISLSIPDIACYAGSGFNF